MFTVHSALQLELWSTSVTDRIAWKQAMYYQKTNVLTRFRLKPLSGSESFLDTATDWSSLAIEGLVVAIYTAYLWATQRWQLTTRNLAPKLRLGRVRASSGS